MNRRRMMAALTPIELPSFRLTEGTILFPLSTYKGVFSQDFAITVVQDTSTWEATTGNIVHIHFSNLGYTNGYRLNHNADKVTIRFMANGSLQATYSGVTAGTHTFVAAGDYVEVDGERKPSNFTYTNNTVNNLRLEAHGIYHSITVQINANLSFAVKGYRVGNELKVGYNDRGQWRWARAGYTITEQ